MDVVNSGPDEVIPDYLVNYVAFAWPALPLPNAASVHDCKGIT